MEFTTLALNVTPRQYSVLISLGNRTVAAITGSTVYTTPSPSILTIQSLVTDCQNALAKWKGSGSNRGSEDDLAQLRLKAKLLHVNLKALMQYCQNTAEIAAGTDNDQLNALLTQSGFDLGKGKSPVGMLEMVQNFHQFISRSIPDNKTKLKWKRPLNTRRSNDVLSYNLYRSTTANLADAVLIAQTSKSEYIDTNPAAIDTYYWYWVAPFGSAGLGIMSEAVKVLLVGTIA